MTQIEIARWTPSLDDWCDACGTKVSLAYAKVTKDGRSLYFCGHHAHAYMAELVAGGWMVQDHTQKLVPSILNK